MAAVPTPTLLLPREEWSDADFDLPEDAPLPSPSDKDGDDEDWDIEMDLGETGGAKAKVVEAALAVRSELATSVAQLPGINIRPPIRLPDPDDEEDEGISTIKASALPTIKAKPISKPIVDSIEEDFEDGFALPTDLTQLSLAPLSLSHKASKTSLEWGDKDNSSSSQSSDAFSSLGFADNSPSSNSTSCQSLPDTETEEDDDELEGLVLPSALFESGHSARQLKKILEMKKKAQPVPEEINAPKINPEDDFEAGLVINDDVDLSPSRLVNNAQTQQSKRRPVTRSLTIPPQRQSGLRPPSRAKIERSKSPVNPPTSSAKQLSKIRTSPSPPLRPPSRTRQGFSALVANFPIPPSPSTSSSNILPAKPGSLRSQKSHSGLKPPSPPSSARKLTRKASLSSLVTDANNDQASGSTSAAPEQSKLSRYEEPTATSRAKSAHKNSTSRMQDFKSTSARPSTPSNPTRLTMPSQSRLKSRPALSQVFGERPASSSESAYLARSTSPFPQRPPSTTPLRSSAPSRTSTVSVVPKLLRRPKRLKTYGDGTELDGIEDLPTDRDKEVRYRVQPKGFGNRIPGAAFPSKAGDKDKPSEKGTMRKKKPREGATAATNAPGSTIAPPPMNSLRRTTRIEFPSVISPSDILRKKKHGASSPSSSTTKRKPTLIRNLGGSNAPKVVGDMKWNPQTLRWEGNDQALRDFDLATGTSSRPALITHLSVSGLCSPVGSLASGARIVGNMIFDPIKMCWVSNLPPEEEEPDVFANMADDENDTDSWDAKAGTIRATTAQTPGQSRRASGEHDVSSSPGSHSRTISESGSDRGSRASMVVCEVDDVFIQSCRDAEERHRIEMRGWQTTPTRRDNTLADSLASDRSYLYEIRALATRKY